MREGFGWGNLREGDHLKEPGVDGRIILKWTLDKWTLLNGGIYTYTCIIVCCSDMSLICQGGDSLLGSTAGGPVMDLANIPDLKPLCYSAASKLFGDTSSTIGGMGVVKNEPGVSGTLASGGGAAVTSPAASHHHHHYMLHPATYHHGYHSYDPGALASVHHTAESIREHGN